MMYSAAQLVLVTEMLFAVSGMAGATTLTCGSLHEPQSFHDAYVNQPVPLIFGDRYPVPRMRIRFINGATQRPLEVKGITVNYDWLWLEYPYSEHAWGAWSDAADSLSCQPDQEGWIALPAHEVLPRGWYDGKYTRWPWPHRPHFESVEVVAFTGYFGRTRLLPEDLKKFADCDLVITVFDGWRTEIKWQAKKNEQQALPPT